MLTASVQSGPVRPGYPAHSLQDRWRVPKGVDALEGGDC
jgi:hypothetical protein